MRQVKVDLMCPYCGFCQILKVPITISSRVYCPSCKQLVFLRYATGVNGELCVFNTIEIIKRYEPSYFIIENPASGRIWKYIEDVMGFCLPYKNQTRYNNYGYPIQKPTKFASNLFLNLNNEVKPSKVEWKYFSRSYNERSNIPQKLLLDIFKTVIKHFEEKTNDECTSI